ncbi:MAG: SagB/ThcOx family dehydrogenase [bacterium]|nr:MAG: SagB/ThcOx family dehydrogenase [bacterium]
MITRRGFLGGGAAGILALHLSELHSWTGTGQTPFPEGDGLSVREAMARRRTVRQFSDRMLREEQLMGVLWAAQGITDRSRGFRTTPSAGALYPLETFALLGPKAVAGLAQGVYSYQPRTTVIERIGDEDSRIPLAEACLGQTWLAGAPVCLVISAVYGRTTAKYGERGVRYVAIEAGCAAQNVFLLAESMGLSAGIVGAFEDGKVKDLVGDATAADPLLVMPVGYRA